ncbi:NAD(P)/FAD-dependent oxidoreductase [uncultured Castellaniella sp.]|uniref:NAD(P)/FAD-dependent oxidoreductase n=1 Tax=uncultured Castellaniella sp. TaxID=647907 RepID=UPI00263286D1|nr:NAD(P)/FAD-dependent oxidoreductase [uncultured Castellaniella sp.]
MKQNAHRVVIVGGGAGGLELAARLGRQFGQKHIVLIDKADSHIWKPSLHEVAAGTLDIHREGLSYFMLARQCGFTFIHGALQGLDRDAKRVRLEAAHGPTGEEVFPSRSIDYDTLVLAIGSKSNFFGTPGAPEHAIALDSTAQAENFRERLLRELAKLNGKRESGKTASGELMPGAGAGDRRHAAEDPPPLLKPDDALHIAIVGGGATGVELAAELVEALNGFAYYGMGELEPGRDVKISLLEGADRILSALPENLSSKARQLLRQRGVMIETSVRVAGVESGCLMDSEGRRHAADLCVWAAGIEAPAILSELGLEANRHHQVVVDGRLQTSDPRVFALGDCAQAPWEGRDRPLPAKAQVASQQAAFLYDILQARVTGQAEPAGTFRFRDHGSLVSVGHSEGVGSLMGVLSGRNWFVEGLLARLMYMSLHLRHHMAVLGVLQTAALALGRLLLRRGAPRVKLH